MARGGTPPRNVATPAARFAAERECVLLAGSGVGRRLHHPELLADVERVDGLPDDALVVAGAELGLDQVLDVLAMGSTWPKQAHGRSAYRCVQAPTVVAIGVMGGSQARESKVGSESDADHH